MSGTDTWGHLLYVSQDTVFLKIVISWSATSPIVFWTIWTESCTYCTVFLNPKLPAKDFRYLNHVWSVFVKGRFLGNPCHLQDKIHGHFSTHTTTHTRRMTGWLWFSLLSKAHTVPVDIDTFLKLKTRTTKLNKYRSNKHRTNIQEKKKKKK